MLSKLPNFTKKNAVICGLKCASVAPAESHPNRYWQKDGKHFVSLYNKAKENKAQLFLVNYKVSDPKVKVIWVKKLDAKKGITAQVQEVLDREQYTAWLEKMEGSFNII